MFPTLDDAVQAYLKTASGTTKSLLAESDIVAAACAADQKHAWAEDTGQDYDDEQVIKHFGMKAKRSRTTLYERLLVGRIFPQGLVIPDLFPHGVREVPEDIHYSHFVACAYQWSEDTPNAPYEFLHQAVLNGWSVRRLKTAIKGQGGKPAGDKHPLYLLDAHVCELDYFDAYQMTVILADPPPALTWEDGSPFEPQPGIKVIVTVAYQPDVSDVRQEGAYALDVPELRQ